MTSMKDSPAADPFSEDDSTDTEQPKSATEETESRSSRSTRQQYPYVLRRDTVKEERTNEKVALLRDEHAAKETEIVRAVADELGLPEDDISIFDIREALYELGENHPDTLAEILLEWGYDAKI